MKSFELIITILFVLVIWMVVIQGMPSHLIMPFLAICFVVLFIGFDNMGEIPKFDSPNGIGGLLTIFSKKCSNTGIKVLDTGIKVLVPNTLDTDTVEDAIDYIKVQRSTVNTDAKAPEKFKDAPTPEFKQESLTYDEYKYRENLFPEASCTGDYLLAEKMKHMGLQPKVSIDAQSRVNKYTNYGYFAEELDSHANSIWWDDETLEDEF